MLTLTIQIPKVGCPVGFVNAAYDMDTVVPWKEAKLTVPTEPLKWPADRLERVSINSFGIGGSNAHVRTHF
jgi:3-oxoacyl-(acyl-carrier-protein) synthase